MTERYRPVVSTFGHGSITFTYYPSSGRVGVVQDGTNSVMDATEFVDFAHDMHPFRAVLRDTWNAGFSVGYTTPLNADLTTIRNPHESADV